MKCELPVQNSRHARIGARQKLPGQMSAAAYVLPWASSHLFLKHWGYLRALRVIGGADRAGQGQEMSLKRDLEFRIGEE